MQAYSKLIAVLIGNLVAILAVYLAGKGLATCVAAPDGTQACTMLGFTTAQVTSAATLAVTSFFVWAFPPNKPNS